jgi:hypothetical protein
MSFAFAVYLISILPSVAKLLLFIAVVLGLAYCMMIFVRFMTDGDSPKPSKWIAISALCCAFMAALIPTEKQMYIVAGAQITENVYNSELGQDVIQLVKMKVKQQVSELKEETQKDIE